MSHINIIRNNMTVSGKVLLHTHTTPTGSFIASPPTPPLSEEKSSSSSAVLRALEDIRCLKRTGQTRVPTLWPVYKLDAAEFSDLEQRLERDKELAGFAEDKLRLDYFPSSKRLVLRMPGDRHEEFIARIVKEIQDQLEAIRGPSASFARQIESRASTTFKSSDPDYGRHDPDAQFKHLKAQFPSVIIEVSHSQKKRDLPHLADEYILGSDANIQVVVGIDIEYRGDNAGMATLSVWEPAVVDVEGIDTLVARQTINGQMFRDGNGNAISSPTCDLRIPLRDFAPNTIFNEKQAPEEEIVITGSKMCEYLQAAEAQIALIDSNMGVKIKKTWKQKRPRELTPEEKLLERDEKRFKAEEDKVLKMEALADPEYEP
ncbi:hypothetical protein ONS95_004645 [Cadophora gregata]|uniref:uncharacterized protein n=1 Tax=Cadophora gregata TaxID=51156 RepID=UPI0026DAB4F6|nr:uncharacterized protein ONS95_004645 [Cadophora gregata]KAK0104985.1 hypothetical protein ONS96_004393 [Cadophora gregata f. sp. sojae]KAK0106143.1 hypothetical protein ONS95_004645 [Cadophora gregata]